MGKWGCLCSGKNASGSIAAPTDIPISHDALGRTIRSSCKRTRGTTGQTTARKRSTELVIKLVGVKPRNLLEVTRPGAEGTIAIKVTDGQFT